MDQTANELMRVFQYLNDAGEVAVAARGIRAESMGYRIGRYSTMHEIVQTAMATRTRIQTIIQASLTDEAVDVQALAMDRRILVPINHPEMGHCLVSGTGLTHLQSAEARDHMAQARAGRKEGRSDSRELYALGVDGGKPTNGQPGAQPEWFYKGDGNCLIPSGHPIVAPDYSYSCGEEPEIAGVYVIDQNGVPYRVGFVLANDISDHALEASNYLYVAASKLYQCAISAEMVIGNLPGVVRGESRIRRRGKIIWKRPILSGEENMCHSIENLERHHFKHPQCRVPGYLHVHMFGTSVMSYSDGIRTEEGDVFEMDVPIFGLPLCNPISFRSAETTDVSRALYANELSVPSGDS